jgi:hypothetical protein
MAPQLHRPSATMTGACQKPYQMLPSNELAPAFTGVKLVKVQEGNPRNANKRVPLAPLYNYGRLEQEKEMQHMESEADKIASLYKVDGLYGVVKKHYPHANEQEAALLMEFVLHGLAAFSMINKKMIDGKIEFKDLMGSIMNLGNIGFGEDDFNEGDYQ